MQQTNANIYITKSDRLSIVDFIEKYGSSSLDRFAYLTDTTLNIFTISFEQYKDIVSILITYSIEVYGTVNIQNKWGHTVFHTLFAKFMGIYSSSSMDADEKRYKYFIEQLLLNSGDIDIKNNLGKTAWDQCSGGGQILKIRREELDLFIKSIIVPEKNAIEFIKSVSDTTGILLDVSNVIFSYAHIVRQYEHADIVHKALIS